MGRRFLLPCCGPGLTPAWGQLLCASRLSSGPLRPVKGWTVGEKPSSVTPYSVLLVVEAVKSVTTFSHDVPVC